MPQQVSPSFQARRALLRSLAPRYQQASPAQKTLLLDSFVEWTGYTRKYAIELLHHGAHDAADHPAPSIAPVRTSGAAGLVSDLEGGLLRVCQTAPAVPAHAGDVAGTAWAHVPDGRRAPPVARHECLYSGALLAHPTQTPPAWFVRHHSRFMGQGPDSDAHVLSVGRNRPGFVEMDLVAHCGDHLDGSFLYTLTLTDLATGWNRMSSPAG